MIALQLKIAEAHPATQGHFPSHPILPGAVLLDCVIHTVSRHFDYAVNDIEISVAKFLRPVAPGADLQVLCESTSQGAMRFTVSEHNKLAATGTIRFVATTDLDNTR